MVVVQCGHCGVVCGVCRYGGGVNGSAGTQSYCLNQCLLNCCPLCTWLSDSVYGLLRGDSVSEVSD